MHGQTVRLHIDLLLIRGQVLQYSFERAKTSTAAELVHMRCPFRNRPLCPWGGLGFARISTLFLLGIRLACLGIIHV